MNDYASFYRQIAELEREATRGNRRQRRSGAAWERTPEANAQPEVPRFSPQEVERLEGETAVERARQNARSTYSRLGDEWGPVVPFAVMAGDAIDGVTDESTRQRGRRQERQAFSDVLDTGHAGELWDWLAGLPEDVRASEEARLQAGGAPRNPLEHAGAVVSGLWTGAASMGRDARGEAAAQDEVNRQERAESDRLNALADSAWESGDLERARMLDVQSMSPGRDAEDARDQGDIAAGTEFWANRPWLAEALPGGLGGALVASGRSVGRNAVRTLGREIPEILQPNTPLSETQRLGARTGETGANGEDVLYSATDNARGWRNNALLGGATYLGADALDGELGDDNVSNAIAAGGAMVLGRRFIPNIDSAIPAEVQHLMRQGEIGPDGARNYTPRPRQRLTVDPQGRVAMDYEGSFNTGDGASVGETRSVMRGAREALDRDIAETRRSEYSWTPNDERQAALYRSTFERDTPTNYTFSELPQAEGQPVMRLRRLGAEFEPDPLQAQPVPEGAPFGFEGAPQAGRIIDAEATPAPARRFEAAVRDPETGQVYRGEDHQQAIDSAPDEAVRARLQAAYDAADEDPSVIGFQVDGQFMGREDGLAALRERAGRGRQVRIGEQVNADGSVTPRSPIDWENPNTRLPADDEWFNDLAGMPTPPRMNIVPEGGIPGRSADDMLRDVPDGSPAGGGNSHVLNWLGHDRLIRNPTEADLARLAEQGDEIKYVMDTDNNIYAFSASDNHHNQAMRALRDNGVQVRSLGPGAEVKDADAAGFIWRNADGSFSHENANMVESGSYADFARRMRAPDAPNAGPRRLGDDTAGALVAGGIGGGVVGSALEGEAQASDGSGSDGVPMLPILGPGIGVAATLPFLLRRGRSGRLADELNSQVGMFAGVNARTADRAALARAQEMATSGASRESIWQETGWFQGVDGKWRFEIDDSRSVARNPSAEPGRQYGGALTHPDGMYQAYDDIPGWQDLRDIRVHYTGPADQGALMGVGTPMESMIIGARSSDPRSIALHEYQHGIQAREGMARGGTPEMGHKIEDVERLARQVYEESGDMTDDQLMWELTGREGPRPPDPTNRPAWDDLTRRQQMEWWERGRERAYRYLAGETEARNVELRRNMTAEERRARAPWETQDVPDDQQIVRFDGDRAESRATRRLGSTFDSGVNPERPPVSEAQTGTEAVQAPARAEQTRARGFAPGSGEYRAARNARILELLDEMQPVRNARTGAANPNARLGERLDNGYPAIAERLRAEGYGEVTASTISGVVHRNRPRPAATAASASDEAAAQRLGMSVERYRSLSARKRNEAIAALGLTGTVGALLLGNEAQAQEEIGLPEIADPALEGARAEGDRQTLDLGDGRLEHRQIWRLSDGSYALRVTIQDAASQNQVGPHRWYEWAPNEPLLTGGPGEAPSRQMGQHEETSNDAAGFAGVPIGIAAGAAISRRRPIAGAATGSLAGLTTSTLLGGNDEQALWSTVLPAALGPMARHVGDYGVDTVRASLPSGRARIGQLADALPNEAPIARGQQVMSDDYLGPRQMVDMDSGAYGVPALDAAAPRRLRATGAEIAEQGYSQPIEALPSMRERYEAMRPADRLRLAEAEDASQRVRAARLNEARQASTSARLDRAAGEWGEREALPAPTTSEATASADQAWWFDPVTGEPLYGAQRGRQPPPRTPRRPMTDLGQSAQQRRLGEVEGGTGAQAARSVAERELGQSFKTGAAAMRALRERMTADPAFAEKMNRLYPALVAAVLGGGVAGEANRRLN